MIAYFITPLIHPNVAGFVNLEFVGSMKGVSERCMYHLETSDSRSCTGSDS